MKRTVAMVAGLMMSACLWSQSMEMLTMPNADKMPTAFVHRILQDRYGYMWYATDDAGLCRDNGYQIDVLRNVTSTGELFGKRVLCLSEDRVNGKIWFGTNDGLFFYDELEGTIEKVVPAHDLDGKEVAAVWAERNGKRIWIAQYATIFSIDSDGHEISRYESSDESGNQCPVSNLLEDNDGRIWATQWKCGLLMFDPERGVWTHRKWMESYNPNNLVEDPQHHCFWIATWGQGVVRFEKGIQPSDDNTTRFDNIWNERVWGENYGKTIELLYDSLHSRLWTTTMDGMYVYDISSTGELSPAKDLSPVKGFVDDVSGDSGGNIWVAANLPKTMVFTNQKQEVVRYALPAFENRFGFTPMAQLVASEANGGFWLWTLRAGVVFYDIKTDTCISPDMKEKGWLRSVEQLISCEQGGVYVVVAGKIFKLSLGTQGTIDSVEIYHRDNIIHSLVVKGNILWMGGNDDVACYDRIAGKETVSVKGIGKVIALDCCGSDDVIYALSDTKGLMRIGKDGKCVSLCEGTHFSDMAYDENNSCLYIGMDNGQVKRYDLRDNKEEDMTLANEDEQHPILKTKVDKEGNLWLVYNLFTKVYNPSTKSIKTYRCSDRGIEMGYMKCVDCDKRTGRVLMGGANAVCEVWPSANADTMDERQIKVTTVMADSFRLLVGANRQTVEVEPNTANVEIRLSTMDIIHAHDISYAYRIREYGDAWIYLPQGDNVVRLTNLSKGTYQLEAMATDLHGVWGKPQKCLSIIRLPAWWQKWWMLAIYWIVGLGLVSMIFYTYWLNQKRKRKEQMEQRMTEFRLQFFTNISHELRTPISLILSPVGSLMDDYSEDKARQLLPIVHDNAEGLMELVNRLLDFRRIEKGNERLNLKQGDIVDFIRTIAMAFKPMAEKHGIVLGQELPDNPLWMDFDDVKVKHIMNNLLSNAIKYTESGGEVKICLTHDDPNWVSLSVTDTGIGIPQDDLQKIFERYYQSDNRNQSKTSNRESGFGIGLHIVREYVELHGGCVSVESKVGEGSSFIVRLPVKVSDEKTLAKSVAVADEDYEELSGADTSKPVILLVDDNEDFRTFLSTELRTGYNVLQASNGEEALAVVRSEQVNIVVSDVMMPVMDGMELCRQIKTNPDSSHLFVILLTAKAGMQSELEGYGVGADCYVNKPFNMAILRNRIDHFIQLQQQRFEQFRKDENLKVEDMEMSSIDKTLLDNAIAFVEKHLDDEEYSVEDFSSDMCMSRMNLYRKLHGLTGQSPLEFMRTIRLKRGAQMIKEGTLSVTEIAEKVGFGTVRNFRKCFKDLFGMSPSEYAK